MRLTTQTLKVTVWSYTATYCIKVVVVVVIMMMMMMMVIIMMIIIIIIYSIQQYHSHKVIVNSNCPLSLEPAGTSPIRNLGLSIRINLFRSSMIPRATRNYRRNVPNYMFTRTDNRTFFIKPPRTYTKGRHRTLFWVKWILCTPLMSRFLNINCNIHLPFTS